MSPRAFSKLIGISIALCFGLMQVAPTAQSGGGEPKAKVRLNQIIEQFEQGKPAFMNEHWQFISLEHTLLLDNYAKAMASLRPTDGAVRPRLTDLRNGLLHLHKALLDSESATYDNDIARITSKGQLLELVLHDPWFAWLHELGS